MAVKDDFLKEVKVGDNLELIIGSKEIEGILVSIDNNTVRLSKKKGTEIVLSIDSISCYEIKKKVGVLNLYKHYVNDICLKIKKVVLDPIYNNSTKKEKMITTIINNKSVDSILSLLEKRGEKFFVDNYPPKLKNYKDYASDETSVLKDKLLGIANSIDNTIKNNNETSLIDRKIQNNIEILNILIQTDKSITAANMLGSLYYHCKNDLLALENYKKGDDNITAFVIAENINSCDYMDFFAQRHFLKDAKLNPYILKKLISRIMETGGYAILREIDFNSISPMQVQGYSATVKALLLAKGANYDCKLDSEYSVNTVSELIKIIERANIWSEIKNIEDASGTVKAEKPMSECPYFLAAKKAREQEKDFHKAEKLYIESIKNNERRNGATADLVNLMIQMHNITQAENYLFTYGRKYMRDKSYNKALARIEAIKRKNRITNQLLLNSKKVMVDVNNDFFIAQKAELLEKDLQKAITYYKKAISRGQRLSSSVPNLVSIYSRLEMYDDALSLLDNIGKQCMDNAKYLNLKLAVFGSAKELRYKDEIIGTYKKAISLSKSIEKRINLLYAEAGLMNQIGEYSDAIEIFIKCLENITYIQDLAPEKAKRLNVNILIGICSAYVKQNNIEFANQYALKILELQPDNLFAKSVLGGQVYDESLYVDDVIGVSKISDYILQRINKLSLENELKNKAVVQDGVFIGSEEDAKRIIHNLYYQNKASVNDEIQSNNYFAVAKIIRQIIDREEAIEQTQIFNERNYQMQVAIGSYFYGNYRLYRTELTHNFDTARYCFYETISMFQDSETINKCWAAATVGYIETFFCTTDEIKTVAKKYYKYTYDYEKKYLNQIRDVMQKDMISPVEDFVVSMIEMLTYNYRVKKDVLSMIFENSILEKVLDTLSVICGDKITESITIDNFIIYWDIASKKYYAKQNRFIEIIKQTVDSIFIYGQLQDNSSKFNGSDFLALLIQTDKEYIEELRLIFSAMLRYNEESEYDYKAETLGRSDEIRKKLEEKIADNPTRFSFEKLLPILAQLQAKIFKESSLLYGESKPDITVELSGDCSIDESNLIVRAPIAYTNKNNVQNADNVSIRIDGESVEVVNDAQLSRGLLVGNGKPQGSIVTFRVSPDIIKSKAFTVDIHIHYQYRKNMTELEDDSMEIQLPIPLYSVSAFEPIENKFEPYRNGSEVRESSMFYGRDADINSIIKQISDESGNVLRGRCLALYGQTRTGKSSLLYHLERRLREINQEGNIIVNVGSIGEENLSGNDITEFLYTLLDELSHEINAKHPKLKAVFESKNFIIDPEKLLENPERSQLYFNDCFKKINRCFNDEGLNYNIIVMIDEFTYIYDWIRRGIMTDRIMKFWKAFIQNNEIFAIVIGQDHMMQFVAEKQFTNDFGSTDLRKVSYLPEDDAKRLMYEPIMRISDNGKKENRYQSSALDRLYELTAGSAFLIMNLCAGLVDYLNETHTVFITRAHIDEYIKKNMNSFEESRFFEPQYDDKMNVLNGESNKKNKIILHRIAQLSNKKEWTPLSSVIKTEEDKKVLESLEQRDVVIISNGDRCKIKVALYKEWIISKFGLEANNG